MAELTAIPRGRGGMQFMDTEAGVDGAASGDEEAGDLDQNDPDLVEEEIQYDTPRIERKSCMGSNGTIFKI
eukprot:COSAG01_NODE_14092_length_1496_cov_41.167502_2_plen_71_part_00